MNETPNDKPYEENDVEKDVEMDDDARLTAFVLGELDEMASAAVERRLETDASAQREAEEIRRAVAMIGAGLKAEPAPGLTEAQRDTIARGGPADADEPPVISVVRRPWARRAWGGVALAAAACLAVVVFVPMLENTSRTSDVAALIAPDDDARSGAAGGRGRFAPSAAAPGKPAAVSAKGALGRDETLGLVAGAGAEAAPRESMASIEEAGDTLDAIQDAIFQDAAPEDVMRKRSRREKGGEKEISAADKGRSLGDAFELSDRRPSPPAAPAPSARAARLYSEDSRSATASSRQNMTSNGGIAAELDFAEQTPPEATRHRGADRADRGWSGEAYSRVTDNPFRPVPDDPEDFPTFSVDVDTAAYANMRRYLDAGRLPPPDAVRIEELINYFDYRYEPATGEHPFSVQVEVNECPWTKAHRLVRIGLKGRDVPVDMRPATNLVFLVDVSGSMSDANKLPLVKQSLHLLVDHLVTDDRVAIVVYAGAAGLVLPSTYCDEKAAIGAAIDNLQAGGSTAGGAGIELAYGVARAHFIEGGVNRVILCTDGDFNVGASDEGALVRLIEEKRASGVYLSVCGFGTGNWKDAKMEALSNHGNGNAAYIDSLDEAKKVFGEDLAGTLVTIAKDVKIQVDFNPSRVKAFRLIGYENRVLAARDFDDDRVDAGEIGAGHTVTALYEIVPPGVDIDLGGVEPSKYRVPETGGGSGGGSGGGPGGGSRGDGAASDELLEVRLRYKAPDAGEGEESTLVKFPVPDRATTLDGASPDYRFAAAVASFGMILRDSPHKGASSYDGVLDLARSGLEVDAAGVEDARQAASHREEFLGLVARARVIAGKAVVPPPAEPARRAFDRDQPLTQEAVDAMTIDEVIDTLSRNSEARRLARHSDDEELKARLKREFDMLMRRRRDG